MSKETKFFICNHCGNIINYVHNAGVPVVCCGEKMAELIPNTKEAATEKHIPVIKIDGNTVTVNVGEVNHPMVEEHYITWVSLKTQKGCQRIPLSPNESPSATFALADGDKLEAAYAYCNLHGLWKAEA